RHPPLHSFPTRRSSDLEQHSFTDGMTGGRGYIAIAAMIVGKWHPAGAAAACLLFGATEAAQIALQGLGLPSPLLQALPYAVTMLDRKSTRLNSSHRTIS